MAATTEIVWCDSTFNPWIGCTKVSTSETGGGGCDDCYAARSMPARTMGVIWGPRQPRHRTSISNWRQPIAWNLGADAFEREHGRRRRVFCASLADVFDNEVDPAWRTDLFQLIADTPRLDWLVLTKRIGNAERMIDEASRAVYKGAGEPTWPWSNVWLGATVVNQAEANRDIPKLLTTPAEKRFLSVEPMLGPVDIDCPSIDWMRYPEGDGIRGDRLLIDWVICGGESGPKARPMHPDWARSLRDQCAAASVPFLFKQWGEWLPIETDMESEAFADDGSGRDLSGHIRVDWSFGRDHAMGHVGKKIAGRLLDGVEHNGFPEAAC